MSLNKHKKRLLKGNAEIRKLAWHDKSKIVCMDIWTPLHADESINANTSHSVLPLCSCMQLFNSCMCFWSAEGQRGWDLCVGLARSRCQHVNTPTTVGTVGRRDAASQCISIKRRSNLTFGCHGARLIKLCCEADSKRILDSSSCACFISDLIRAQWRIKYKDYLQDITMIVASPQCKID